jgi:hypothetical protein
MVCGAMYWARPDKYFFACTHAGRGEYRLDDHLIYERIEASD